MATNATLTCPAPFLPESAYPRTGGFQSGRFCGPVSADLTCCLSCPLEQWLYSDRFDRNTHIAYWFNVPGLVCQVFLLLSFALLPEDKGHRHYLSAGLCVSLMLLELSFIVPLGAKPNECYDAVTPNDMHSDLACAWSGALLEAGAMAATVWILLRSLWTNLRVCWDIKHTPVYLWLAQAIGWGLPALFLALTLPITGVSYRLGKTCIPNQQNALITWFGWLLAFACLAAALQLATTGFSLWLFMRHFWGHGSSRGGSSGSTEPGNTSWGLVPAKPAPGPTIGLNQKLAWRRVRKVLPLQWRSIAMNVLVIIESIYFGIVFVKETQAVRADQDPVKRTQIEQWSICLIFNGGDKNKCLGLATVFGIDEQTVIASLFMSALIGLFTFALMVRWSMFVGWYELLRNPRKVARQQSLDDFILMSPRRWQFGKSAVPTERADAPLHDRQHSEISGVLPEPNESFRTASLPEAGDVTARHETTDWFDERRQGSDVRHW